MCASHWDGRVCVHVCESTHVHSHVCACVFVHVSGGVAGEKHMGVVGRADKLKHKTANSKERGIL